MSEKITPSQNKIIEVASLSDFTRVVRDVREAAQASGKDAAAAVSQFIDTGLKLG